MTRKTRLLVIGGALSVVAGSAAAFGSAASSGVPDGVSQAATAAGAAAPGPSDALALGPYKAWISHGKLGDVAMIVDSRLPADAIGSQKSPLGVGCDAPSGPTVIGVCGGYQDNGRPSIFVGRTQGAAQSVSADFPGGGKGTVYMGGGLFIVVGPPPANSTSYGVVPNVTVARDGAGQTIGVASATGGPGA